AEADVRRTVSADDAARALLADAGARGRRRLAVDVEGIRVHRAPAVVLAGGGGLLEAAGYARGGAATLDRRGRPAGVCGCIFHVDSLTLDGRKPRDRRLTCSRTECSIPSWTFGAGSSRSPTWGSTWSRRGRCTCWGWAAGSCCRSASRRRR